MMPWLAMCASASWSANNSEATWIRSLLLFTLRARLAILLACLLVGRASSPDLWIFLGIIDYGTYRYFPFNIALEQTDAAKSHRQESADTPKSSQSACILAAVAGRSAPSTMEQIEIPAHYPREQPGTMGGVRGFSRLVSWRPRRTKNCLVRATQKRAAISS